MEQRIKNMEKRQRGFAIERIYNVHPGSGKRYYLRMLLKTVKGCMSYEDIRTVDGVVYPTFKEVCQVLGYLDDDNEWIQCINEVANWASGNQLHQLFTTILCHSEVSNPKILWESTCEVLSEDILYSRRKLLNFQTLQLTDGRIKAYALMEIEKLMR
jgi:hypothetical protein